MKNPNIKKLLILNPPICSLCISLIKSDRRYGSLRGLTSPASCFPLAAALLQPLKCPAKF